jgi:uncharacterized membrane protein
MFNASWTDNDLEKLPRSRGFRLRGLEMTRLETFVDAAFAFAVTMLVISVGTVPGSFQELITALKGAPAFAASFALIMSFWVGHRRWSRRYGLEDGIATLVSLALIFVMLVYVFPLRLMFSALFAWISGGWLPAEFTVQSTDELLGLFVVYGIGTAILAGMMLLLYVRARSAAESLRLDALERTRTAEEIAGWTVIAVTGLVSALFARVMPPRIGVFAGFAYATLAVSMTLVSILYDKKASRVDSR